MRAVILLLLLASLSSAFSIDSYYTHATVLTDGSLRVYEDINFTLDQQYNEGFRDIRKEDFGSLDDIAIQSVKVNGQDVPSEKSMNGDQAEIIWKRTFVGKNEVELSYTIKDRARLYNDFAKVCFEHYGANWPVEAKMFSSRMTLPEASRGKEMHFQIYSAKEGDAHVDDLSIVVEMEDVPPGNYVGGCYLYDKGALETDNIVNASALEILESEREAYGSRSVLEPEEEGSMVWCCLPLSVLTVLLAFAAYRNAPKVKKMEESILPPGKDEPAVVSAIVRNKVDDSAIMAATVLDLINRGFLDIVELEKKTGGEKERTILLLKRRPDNPKAHEKALLDMLFPVKANEVDLDGMAGEYAKMRSKADAKNSPVAAGVKEFKDAVEESLKENGVEKLAGSMDEKLGILAGLGMFALIGMCFVVMLLLDSLSGDLAHGAVLEASGTVLSGLISMLAAIVGAWYFFKPTVEKGMEARYARWDAFARAVKASRLKEYPPASAVMWGEILVYATALGMADKVKRHLSELDALTLKRVEQMEQVSGSSVRFYIAALGVYNLKTYGNRSGRSSHGGFSSGSSGGWSSGGGGFSGGSSGGGGFR